MDKPGANPDRLMSEPHEYPDQHQQQERKGSMTLGAPPSTNNGASSKNGDASTIGGHGLAQDPSAEKVSLVVNSEIGVSTLLHRLKQSIASAKEFSLFLKKRSTVEEEHCSGLKRLCRLTAENIRKPDHRHGTFLQNYEEMMMIHERMADNGQQFAISLSTMHDDLWELTLAQERVRKHWKANGLASEQRVSDAENALRKSKAKYDALADDYDRTRTGDRQQGKKFGLKGPKSAAQHEEDLLRKVHAADADYASKVQSTQSMRNELMSKLRPEAVRALEDAIKEVDAGTTLQMQKFAAFNEKLLLSNGLNISPMSQNPQGAPARSLRQVVSTIDNERDYSNFITSYHGKIPARGSDLKYERNAVLGPTHQQSAPPLQTQADPSASYASRQGPPQQSFGGPQQQSFGASPTSQSASGPTPTQQSYGSTPWQQPTHAQISQPYNSGPPPMQQHERNPSQGPPQLQQQQQYSSQSLASRGGPPSQQPQQPQHGAYNTGSIGSAGGHTYNAESVSSAGGAHNGASISSAGPPQLGSLPFQSPGTAQPPSQPSNFPPSGPAFQQSYTQPPANSNTGHLPPLKPVFGLSLEQLFERDGSAVPMVVYQCIQAVDLFGLEIEGLYRLSGTQSHIGKLKSIFDNDSTKVDFRNPESFYHDVNSVAGLLKQFFRELPDPLLTHEHYTSFIEAAKNEDDIVRRDSLHAIINALPDPNYATLRAITLHLNRVAENSGINRMNASNLGIVFGPTLMGSNPTNNIQDAGWQVQVINTILNNCYQIFDDD